MGTCCIFRNIEARFHFRVPLPCPGTVSFSGIKFILSCDPVLRARIEDEFGNPLRQAFTVTLDPGEQMFLWILFERFRTGRQKSNRHQLSVCNIYKCPISTLRLKPQAISFCRYSLYSNLYSLLTLLFLTMISLSNLGISPNIYPR